MFHCFPHFYSVFWACLETQIVQQCVKIVCFEKLSGCQKWGFLKENYIFSFCLFCCRNRNRKKKNKQNGKGQTNPIQIGILRWSSKNVRNPKVDFYQKLPDTICVRKGEKTRIFVLTICFGHKWFFGPKQCKPGNTTKIGVSAEIAQNQKWHLFFEKGVFFWHGWKKWVLLTVFLKSCVFSESTVFKLFSAKHSFSKTKTVWWKKQKSYEK